MINFPYGFLFGAATAAHQVEGSNVNSDWWEHENLPGSPATDRSGDACSSWTQWRKDIALLRELGLNGYRFSIEWSRVEPARGRIDREAIANYRRQLQSLREEEVTSMLTLHHFTNPRWFAAEGGWSTSGAVDRFATYASIVADELGDVIDMVCSINEPQVYAHLAYISGEFPPRIRDDEKAQAQATSNFLRAHARATMVFRGLPVGMALAITPAVARTGRDRAAASRFWHRFDQVYLDALRTGLLAGMEPVPDEEISGLAGSSGFVGVNYYMPMFFGEQPPVGARTVEDDQGPGTSPSEGARSQLGWPVAPEYFVPALTAAAELGVPIYVTENGIATDDDSQRIDFVTRHLEQLDAARAAGIDIRGYFYWSLMDNFEWNRGYTARFGLAAVDRDHEFDRRIKPSGRWYGSVAASHQLPPPS